MIGESHWPGYLNYSDSTLNCHLSPQTAAASEVAGFNANSTSYSNPQIYFRPWIELEDPSGACFPFLSPASNNTYQNVNYNGSGPYTPRNQ
jgi:hypothetical protein